ncbi:MAG TPA: lysophospholipid acyltransferase family protein [Acidimicrobiales bacterium]|nr:lysophospholipid acyltransferase family protein [Acidimicrobiales bacterium]
MAYWVLKVVLTPVLLILYRVRVEGRSNVPRKGPVILACNHQSFIDSIFLPLCVPRRVTFVAKAEYFENPRTAWFFRAVGMIPLKRDGGSASERALAAARDVLTSGGVLGIYPEGTRSPDGRLYRGHTGVARLAMQCGAPVVPVAQFGTAAVQPIGVNRPRIFKPVRVRMGRPITVPCLADGEGPISAEDLRRCTDSIMAAIAELSGQERVDRYAKRDRGRMAAPGSEAEPDHATGDGAVDGAVLTPAVSPTGQAPGRVPDGADASRPVSPTGQAAGGATGPSAPVG